MFHIFVLITLTVTSFPFTAVAFNCEALVQFPEHPVNGTNTATNQFVPELEGADYKELISCLATTGQAPIPQDQANNIWKALKKVRESLARYFNQTTKFLLFQYFSRIEDIPAECFKFLGYAMAGIPVDDFQNITMDSIDIVQVFGNGRGLKNEQLAALAEGVIRDWSEKVPSTLSEFDLIALGQILCHFNKTDIARIHADAYKGAAMAIGGLRDCSPEINQAFAQLAIQPKAFGPTNTWSQFDVATVGNVISGLPPDAYAQIPERYIKDMKKKQKEEN